MALKFNLKNVTKDDIEDARKDFRTGGGYDGPTPPPDLYNVRLDRLWSGENKAGATLVARLVLKNEDEKKEYNDYWIYHNMTIPDDPKHEHFTIRMKSLDDFFRAITGGGLDVADFVTLANAGKVHAGDNEKQGDVITQIGKFKIENAKEFTIKTKPPREYNGKEFVNVHYIDTRSIEAKASGEDGADDYDDADDIDDMLEEI